MKRYTNIKDLWSDLKNGKRVYWHHDGYQVIIEDAIPNNKFQSEHFTFNNGKVLSVRYLKNWFGGLMGEDEIKDCYSEV
jgi:hypothetical protein